MWNYYGGYQQAVLLFPHRSDNSEMKWTGNLRRRCISFLDSDMDKSFGFRLQELQMAEVTSCDFSLNYLLAVGSSNKSVRILEWKTGLGFVDLSYSPLHHHKYGVTSVRFSPKGTILASSSLDGTAVLIDVFSGTKIFTVVQYNTSNIKFCEFTFDCLKLITAADDGVICFWDLIRHCQIRHFRLHEDDYSLRGLAVSPDSEYLLSIDSGNLLKLWLVDDVVNNRPECLLLKKNIHEDVFCCDFSPVKNITGGKFLKLEYRIVTSGADSLLKIWDVIVENRTEGNSNCDLILFRVLKQDNDVHRVRFSPEGSYLVGTGLDSLVRLWEAHTGNCLEILQGHTRFVTCAAFSKDSLLMATGSIDKTVVIWDLSQKLTLDSDLLAPCKISCHFTHVDTINYSTRQKPTDETKKYNEFAVVQKITFSSTVNSAVFQGDDILAVALGKKIVTMCREQDGKYVEKEQPKEHEYSINQLDVSSCGKKIISSSADGVLIFWDLHMNLTYKMKAPNCSGSIRTCRFSPDSKFIAAGGDDQNVYLWDAKNLEFIRVLQGHENAITAVAFTPDGGLLISSCCGSELILQNLEEDKSATIIHNAHDLGVLCCDFSSATLESDCHDMYNMNRVDQKAFLLATGGNDSLVKLWKVLTSEIQMIKVLSGHGGTVNDVKFSPTEAFILASCSSDCTVRIWDAKTTECLHVLNCHQGPVTTCSFSKGSSLFATGSLDKSVLILNLTERFYHEPNELDTNSNKLLEKWTTSDVVNWFLDVGCPEIADKIYAMQLSGRRLMSISEDCIPDLGLNSEKEEEFQHKVLILKKSSSFPREVLYRGKKVPHKFLCPITHQIMKEPVICSDGYTYDRASLTEWFLGGKLISPITKECLTTTKLLPYSALKINIYKFLHDSEFYK